MSRYSALLWLQVLRCKSGHRPKAGRQHHRGSRAGYPRFRSAEGRRLRYRGANGGLGHFRHADQLDDKGKAQPKLALSWSDSEDFKTWTFKLRPGVKFHDGTTFNAEAVKANFDRQKDPANKCRCAFYIAKSTDVQAPDELTVVYNLNDPTVKLPALMSIPSSNNVVQSPTAWKAKGDDYNRNPVGTGPYIVKSWTAGDRMVLERNPDYWDKGQPYLDRIVLQPLPDAQSRFASLQSGEADIIWDDEYDADNIQKAQKDPKLTVHEYVGSGAPVYAFNTKAPPFDDVRVRQALVMAIDPRRCRRRSPTVSAGRPAIPTATARG